MSGRRADERGQKRVGSASLTSDLRPAEFFEIGQMFCLGDCSDYLFFSPFTRHEYNANSTNLQDPIPGQA